MNRNPVNVFPIIKSIAETALKNQATNDGDWYDSEGFLVCGVCGERKQTIMDIADPLPDDLKHTSPLKVTRDCYCKRHQVELEAEEKQFSRLWESSMLEEKYKEATFENYVVNQDNETNFKRCKRYAEKFEEMYKRSQGILMYGDVGTSKSWSAVCICNYLMRHGYSCIVVSPIQILDLAAKDSQKANTVIDNMRDFKLLVIDDLGAERNTGYAAEKVYGVINDRILAKKPMIVTTNLSLEEMKEEQDMRFKRIYDRIFEACYPLKFTGKSWRKAEAKERFDWMTSFLDED